ncbi:MAG TPA: glutamine--tRNA ligase [Phycisphaerales bacterium]|nr:glutamine--tRNA ligase [Phycisphaerales bacterium]|tara:strand:- start:29292 stop:30998 length:1707 start_codon:yes stop_codon:yes gene_type:complete
MTDESTVKKNFLTEEIEADFASGRYTGKILTRFPPEPNGYLHIGHAKAICIDFGLAQQYGGGTNLRMDDTNPSKEEQEYIDAIQDDIHWLGFKWANLLYASDYFQQLYDWAVALIKADLAYVDDQTPDQMRANRGTLTEPGTNSPFRDRTVEENLDLFERMKNGEFPDGTRVLRAKIDMANPNLVMRDPTMYRIMHAHHPRTGDKWCIYPMYDYAHGQSDWLEGITHSLCSLEFKNNRELYEWFIDRIAEVCGHPEGVPHKTRQIEFARGNISYMITSKRKLLKLITDGVVAGWDDPRMPTIRGMRRRGFTPGSIKRFWEEAGVAKRENLLEFAKLESFLRDELNKVAQRRMAVIDPIKVIITNYPEGQVEMMTVVNNPEDESAGTRQVPFSRELYIERDDYMPNANRKFFRLTEGREVRLRSGYWIKCVEAIKDADDNVIELHCTYDPLTKGGSNPPADEEGKVRKVKGTLHWVSAEHAIDAEVRLYEHLFTKPKAEDGELMDNINPDSLKTVTGKIEPSLADFNAGDPIQFERLGYFTPDTTSTPEKLVFNRTVTLKDSWAKQQSK